MMKLIALIPLLIAASAFGQSPAKSTPGEGFVEVPGGPVWYSISGNGAGIPLLTLHGGPGGTSCEFSVLEPLGEHRPVIRYDQLGSGRSGRPEDLSLWETERFVEALHTVRNELGLEQMHLLGHSWGGALAAAYLLEKGTKGVVSVTFSSPLLSTELWIEDANLLRAQLPVENQQLLSALEDADNVDSDEYQQASALFYERHVYAGPKPPSLGACDGAPRNGVIYRYMWGPTEFNASGNLLRFDVTTRLGEIDIPVLFIAGEFDEARPQRMVQFQELIPGAKLEVIKDAAHATYRKFPRIYMEALEAFLRSAEAVSVTGGK